MRQLLLKRLRNQKGLTLIELLAVIVILGIIAAIAVPSIPGIIDNSKKDAHVANAQQMINATKLAVVGNPDLLNLATDQRVPLGYLINEGYIEKFSDPDTSSDYKGVGDTDIVSATTDDGANADDQLKSYVEVTKSDNTYSYKVRLEGISRGILAPTSEDNLDRTKVTE